MKLASSLTRHRQVYVFAFLTSILLSLLLDYRYSVINPDGICYLMSAEMLGSAPLRDVMKLCPQSQWPFYSGFIYVLAQISHLSYALSAQILNGLLSLVSVITFINIVKLLGGNQRVMWLAALVILFDHQFNIVRDAIIRDHGFWAFYLISIYLLLKYFQQSKWTTALLWSASLVLATLFRIEGAIFLLALPFIALFYPQTSLKDRVKIFITLNFPIILMCLTLVIWLVFHPDQMQQLGRVQVLIHQIQNGVAILAERFDTVKESLIQYVFPIESIPDAGAGVVVLWIGIYLYNLLLTLSYVYAILIAYAFKNRVVVFPAKSSLVIWGYIAVNAMMTLGFLAESLFISKRYLIALTLVLMVWVPFAINDLIKKWSSTRHRVFLGAMAFLFFVYALGGVVEFGRTKYYVREAGTWLASEVPLNASLYVNDFQLMYYSHHFGMKIFEVLPTYLLEKNVTGGKWKKFDYIALRLRKKESGLFADLNKELSNMTPVKIFSDKHGNQIAVYKLHENEKLRGEIR